MTNLYGCGRLYESAYLEADNDCYFVQLLFCSHFDRNMDCSREVSEFVHDTCWQVSKPASCVLRELHKHIHYPAKHTADESETSVIPQVTGSTAEFCIVPMLSCIGDIDVMFYYCNEVAMPEGHPPPTWLPEEFDKQVKVYEIRDTGFPGYVFLVLSYLLRKCGSDGNYSAIRYNTQQSPLNHSHYIRGTRPNMHGPAYLHQMDLGLFATIFGEASVRRADGVI